MAARLVNQFSDIILRVPMPLDEAAWIRGFGWGPRRALLSMAARPESKGRGVTESRRILEGLRAVPYLRRLDGLLGTSPVRADAAAQEA